MTHHLIIQLKISIIVAVLVAGCTPSSNTEKEYYETGEVMSESQVENGLLDGVQKEYYKSGQLKQYSEWHKGKRNGLSEEYYKNGVVKRKGEFKDDKPVDTVFFYYKKGGLQEMQIFKNGKMIDFVKLDKEGNKKANLRMPVFFSQQDTVKLGDKYKFEMRLGNRIHEKTLMVLGPRFNENNFLTDTTAVIYDKNQVVTYEIQPTELGINKIHGYVGDVNVNGGGKAKVDIMPFVHQYYVVND